MLSNFLIKIIVFLLPTQLGLHFWPAFSRVAGIKIDYLSPTLYLLDILLLLLIFINSKRLICFVKKNIYAFATLIIFAIINTLFSVSPLNSLFWWLRALLYLMVFFVLRLRNLKWEQICTPLFYSTILIVFIELIQFIRQSSLGGAIYYLGERAFSSSTPGIGRINLLGLEFLRPTSVFSHANSLAGYLLTVFYLFSRYPSKPWQKLIPFLGILLSFSKTAIFALAIIIFNLSPVITITASFILTLTLPLLQNFTLSWQSLTDRLFFYNYQKNIMVQNLITGVGLGGYIPSLGKLLPGSFLTPSKLQPIHNLPYLMFAELGITGTALLLLTLFKKKISDTLNNPRVIGLLALILFTGVFDHYTWTLPQNKLIFLLALAIML